MRAKKHDALHQLTTWDSDAGPPAIREGRPGL